MFFRSVNLRVFRNASLLSLLALGLGSGSGCSKSVSGGEEEGAQRERLIERQLEEAPARPAAAEPVDTCLLLDEEEAASILGTSELTVSKEEAVGSMLGSCTYRTGDFTQSLSVSARPAKEFSDTVSHYKLERIAGMGEEAYHSPSLGMLVKVPGKPYSLHLLHFPKQDLEKLKAAAERALK